MRPGWFVVCHPAAYRFAYYAQKTDPEQVAELDGFISRCGPGMVLFDIGAHFGIFSLAALYYGGGDAKAVAVDPSPWASRMLGIQAKLNHVADRLSIVEASASDKNGSAHMVAAGVPAAGYFVGPAGDHSADELTQTRAVTLDGLVEELKMLPTHIKIDVEGLEAAVLRGAQQVLSRAESPQLFIELHNRIVREATGDPVEPLLVLDHLGYKTFTVDGIPIRRDRILDRPLARIVARKANP